MSELLKIDFSEKTKKYLQESAIGISIPINDAIHFLKDNEVFPANGIEFGKIRLSGRAGNDIQF